MYCTFKIFVKRFVHVYAEVLYKYRLLLLLRSPRCHLGSLTFWLKFKKNGHCIHIFWYTLMVLGHSDPWVESHLVPQQKWGQRRSRVIDLSVKVLKQWSLYPHKVMYFHGTRTQRFSGRLRHMILLFVGSKVIEGHLGSYTFWFTNQILQLQSRWLWKQARLWEVIESNVWYIGSGQCIKSHKISCCWWWWW